MEANPDLKPGLRVDGQEFYGGGLPAGGVSVTPRTDRAEKTPSVCARSCVSAGSEARWSGVVEPVVPGQCLCACVSDRRFHKSINIGVDCP